MVYVGYVEVEGGCLIVFMFGKIVVLLVEQGVSVMQGMLLFIMEVMKMEYIIVVFLVGIVEVLCYVVGDQVVEGVQLLDFKVV